MEKIKVTARLRPSILDNNVKIFNKVGNKIKINNEEKNLTFNFDEIFDEDSSNEKIFNKTIKNYIDSSLKGFNFTLFAYGQTGSGKTHTMLGPQNKKNIDENNILNNYNGVLIYSLIHLFDKIKEDKNSSYFIKASYMEIYNEYVYDLLDDSQEGKPLAINETKNKEFIVKGLKTEDISSTQEVLFMLQKGENLRRYSESLLKHKSSRSHTVLQIKIKKIKNEIVEKARNGSDDDTKPEIVENTKSNGSKVIESLINFIDLAGSERTYNQTKQENYNNIDTDEQLKEKAKGLMKEGKYINKSLFFLTRVISLLSESKNKNKPIPFRDSTLTKLLKNSLGGNSKTTIILNLHNDDKFIEEGISTLRFGSNAKKIVNKVQANILTQNNNKSLQILVRNYENKIMILQNSVKTYHDKNIKLSLTIDKLLIEKMELQKEINEFDLEEKSILKSQKSFINMNSNIENYKNLWIKSENIIEWQNKIINKLHEFSQVYLEKIKIITGEYQEEFIFSNEQRLKLEFFEKLEGFSMMTDNDWDKMGSYINQFKIKLKDEKIRRKKIIDNQNNIEKLNSLKLWEIDEQKKKKELLNYFEEKFQTFINLKNVCNKELDNLNNILEDNQDKIKIDEFLKNIKEINFENKDVKDLNDNYLKDIFDNFKSKFDEKTKKKEKLKVEKENSQKKKKLFKVQSYEISNENFKSTLNKNLQDLNDWKQLKEQKKNLGLDNKNDLIIEEDEEEEENISNYKDDNNKDKIDDNNKDKIDDNNFQTPNKFNDKNSNYYKTLPQHLIYKKRTTTQINIKKSNSKKDLKKKVSTPAFNSNISSKYTYKNKSKIKLKSHKKIYFKKD